MNKRIFSPIPAVSDAYVWWPELVPVFAKTFPRIIQDATDNDKRCRVLYLGAVFEIVPEPCPGYETRFMVWGPPHLNQFPDTH